MTYPVTVTREGKWWMLAIPELDGLTQARRLSEAEQMAKEYIAVTRDIPIDNIDVDLTIAMDDITQVVKAIKTERAEAARLEHDATKRAEKLAQRLNQEGVPLRDIGTILGVSHQRAHQLATA